MKGEKGENSPKLKEAIIYPEREEVAGRCSKEPDNAVNELKSNAERLFMKIVTFSCNWRVAVEELSDSSWKGFREKKLRRIF